MLIKGKQIILYERTKTGCDPFGKDVFEERAVLVDNVLINTYASTEVVNTDDYEGKKQQISISVPKNDTHTWAGSSVMWRGHRYNIVGPVKEGDDDLIPLDWNGIYIGERYE